MSTYGKVSAWLTMFGLIGVFILMSMVGNEHNKASKGMSESLSAIESAKVAVRKQELDLIRISNELARAQLGWDKSWNIGIPANRAVTSVLVQNDGRLLIAGIGRENGLVPIESTNEAGETVTSPPAVHAFKQSPEGGMRYIGEFYADMAQGQIGPTSVTLIPNWQWTNEELVVWASNPEGAWRFRTLMPAAPRKKIDQLNAGIVRLRELFLETDRNYARQEQLLTGADSQLDTRKGELLGTADAVAVPGRPELSDGLLKTIKSAEDDRNALQVDIDQLRRNIKAGADERDDIQDRLQELLQELPDADGDDYLTEGRGRATN